MIQTYSLLPGVTLRCHPDDRFKQGCLSVQFVRAMTAEEASLNALLPSVLVQGTEHYPDLRAITRLCDDLYGASVNPSVRRVGDVQSTGFYMGFMEDRFALPGDRVLLPLLDFLEELLTHPLLEGDGFSPEIVEVEKTNLIYTIESEINDKAAYAMTRLTRTMCSADSFGIPRLGDVASVEAITPQSLYAHFRKVLRESPVELFYVGSLDPQALIRPLTRIFAGLERDPQPRPAQLPFRDGGGQDVVETMEVSQGKLCLGFVTPNTNHTPQFAATQTMNMLLGAGMTSKLFQNVREKLSLCYSIGSHYVAAKGLITISAGVDFDREPAARAEILRQLEAVCSGDFTSEELEAARQALLSGLRSVEDSPHAIESYYGTAALGDIDWTAQQHIAAVEAVTPEQIAEAARSLKLHTTYFLKGVEA